MPSKPKKSDGFQERPQATYEAGPAGDLDLSGLIGDPDLIEALGRGTKAAEAAQRKAGTRTPPHPDPLPAGEREPRAAKKPSTRTRRNATPEAQPRDRRWDAAKEDDAPTRADVSSSYPSPFAKPALSDGGAGGVSATVQALEDLIQNGRPELQGKPWVPHRPARPEKWEGGKHFEIASDFEPGGDQPTAIVELVDGITARSATRCCSASPAPARPSPWPR